LPDHHLARVGQGLLGQVDAAQHPRHFFYTLALARLATAVWVVSLLRTLCTNRC
jgi:hypothetical protein